MNKHQLIAEISSGTGINRQETAEIVETFLGKIAETIAKGEEVRLVGFGAFSISHRKPSAGRDPRTGAPISIGSVARAKFRPGKVLKELVS
ncbi:HU family DNA-binding protein [Sphingomonas sp. AP4-R1]|uniref:HU family DNA-binding protein n=1 Tax=Sphingomonas sp. AP4-R1 TaxID=2735134 RepID=UPI0014938F16|nr:HU family DNA-binding protein [Sphingomonas sp. AP4-R1]QJU59351.1 HU family DNA-binding protein [Sphingomonas sp. AP4-R1]